MRALNCLLMNAVIIPRDTCHVCRSVQFVNCYRIASPVRDWSPVERREALCPAIESD
jgi:hypothetical protein